MNVIAELSLRADQFELGRILSVEGPTTVVLETLVPVGERPVPFFRVHDDVREDFEQTVRNHSSVNSVTLVEGEDGEALYALDWDVGDHSFFDQIKAADASLLGADGDSRRWEFELRFPSHDHLSAFRDGCEEAGIAFTVDAVYNPTTPDVGPHYGLTPAQREALVYAVANGYYSLPRGASTADIAAQFDISDQAATERLRRAVVTLTTNALTLPEPEN
jgi:hypothetical protein